MEKIDFNPHRRRKYQIAPFFAPLMETKGEIPDVVGLDLDDPREFVNIVSNEGDSLRVKLKHACLSGVIKRTFLETDHSATMMRCDVSSLSLKLIVEYFNIHKGVPPPKIQRPIVARELSKVACQEDTDLVERVAPTRKVLYDLINAANLLEIPGLLEITTIKVALLMKGQPIEKIREILNPNVPHEK